MVNQPKKEKKLPIRKCIGCNEHFPKNELIRVLRTPDGGIVIDAAAKMSGRGAYLCRSASCLKKARQKKRLDAALEVAIADEVYERLIKELEIGKE